MAIKPTAVGVDGHAFNYGPKVLVERGLPKHRDDTNRWFVYRKIDVTDDENTLETETWEEMASFPEDEPGVMPAKAEARAIALADKE